MNLKPVMRKPKRPSKNKPVSSENIQVNETLSSGKVNTHTMDAPHQTPADSVPRSDQASPLLNPDFQIIDIAYWPERTRIRVRVRVRVRKKTAADRMKEI
ncbi:MAG: hypothetical protein R6U68_02285 [Desulfobacteraceae bacterium]